MDGDWNGITDPDDLTAATDEEVLNSSSSDNERIEEPEEFVPVSLMRNPAEAGVRRRRLPGRAQRQRNPPGWVATDQWLFYLYRTVAQLGHILTMTEIF